MNSSKKNIIFNIQKDMKTDEQLNIIDSEISSNKAASIKIS
jgi:hypothetical protein